MINCFETICPADRGIGIVSALHSLFSFADASAPVTSLVLIELGLRLRLVYGRFLLSVDFQRMLGFQGGGEEAIRVVRSMGMGRESTGTYCRIV